VPLALKRAYADGTVAVDMDPLSLLCRLATSVPPPRFHTVKYAGVLAAACPWRIRIARAKSTDEMHASDKVGAELSKPKRAGIVRRLASVWSSRDQPPTLHAPAAYFTP
jgi:hypothetical protein